LRGANRATAQKQEARRIAPAGFLLSVANEALRQLK
jgi:hypothetical protein